MQIKTGQFAEAAKAALNDSYTRIFLDGMHKKVKERLRSMETFPDPAAARELGASIRAETVAELPELLEKFEKNATAQGARVIWARDAEQANQFIVELARENGIAYVTKGKSMVSEEIGLNDALVENGINVFETDLGEFIIQLLDRPPFHIVGPAINIPVEEICDIFLEKKIIEKPTLDPVELGYAARRFLRDKFQGLEMGITGINIAVAETGTIINVENEGNIRFNKSSPKIQVSIMSLEKVVATMKDAVHVMRLLCRNCTGQKLSAYVTLDSGPKAPDEIDGPEQLYIVIVDNGRSDFYADPKAREALRCIRCGACLGSCPVYTKIGGYPYGWAYSGPIGQVLNPLLLGLDKTGEIYRASTLCGNCKSVCPVGIDHPSLFLYFRSIDAEKDPPFRAAARPWQEAAFFTFWAWIVSRISLWHLLRKLARPLLNRYDQINRFLKIPGPLNKWHRTRDLPQLPEKTFRERWTHLNSEVGRRKGEK
ncbi:Predicted L-lactate dehydrogenase, Iron-sulfur cluster-binding subunit YkgF [Olavius sp. associated proteobacterium Delta 1]|nr:Predicted L-lactate dehydrogenase, Iron-sulfur cluster-binding subunit YkgF [Olavius sp. associated proteobacterium Delta 1]